ncbi:MAG TPA: AMP-binding protein [Ramlibacter sp.]|nr:AMP-binding protein [Ramlibacter sp.]
MTPLEVLQRYPAHDYTLYGALASRAQRIPSQIYIEFGDERISYAETLARVHRAMAQLASHGVRKGDRIAVMSHNHPTTVVLLIALAALGATMVGVNPDFGEKEARYVLEHSEASGVVCSLGALATVQAVAAALPQRPWIMTNVPNAAGLPCLIDAPSGGATDAPATVGRPDEVCIFIYTSGTTGFPKGVMHSQRSIVLAGEGFVQRMHLQPHDRLLCIMPMFHVNAIFYSLTGTIAAGATLLLEDKFSASNFWKTVATRRATEVNTIAAVMNILMRRPREEFVPGHTLTKIYGAPFSPEIYRVFEEEFGVANLIEGYGMSEIPGACNNPFDGLRRKGSMGRPGVHPDPAVNLAQVKIVDDDYNEVAVGMSGEIAVRTPTIMKGYYRDPDATATAFRDGFFLTGDLGWIDADGYVWFMARKKDIIRRRGENISGAEIDRVAGDHPEVLEAAAIGVPAELGEEEVLLAVVKKPGSALTEAQVAQWCRARLAAFKAPRYVVFVDALPHTPTHRVAKFELRKDRALKQRAVDLAQAS